ncbi:MAG: TlpA disulfide reductase family protein [Planctomycetota bacterium]
MIKHASRCVALITLAWSAVSALGQFKTNANQPDAQKAKAAPLIVEMGAHSRLFPDAISLPRLLKAPSAFPELTPPAFRSGEGSVCKIYIGGPDTALWIGFEIHEGERLAYVDADRDADLSDEEPVTLIEDGDRFAAPITVKGADGADVRYELFQREPLPRIQEVLLQREGAEGSLDTLIWDNRYGFRENSVNFGGQVHRVGIFDWEHDGIFNGPEDLLMIDLDLDGELNHEISSRETNRAPRGVAVNNTIYRVAIAPDGSTVTFTPAANATVDSTSLDVGEPFPVEQLKTLRGGEFSIDSKRGKWVLVDFWGEWCVPCIAEMPKLVALSESFDRDEFEIVGYLVTGSREQALEAARTHRARWTHALMEGRAPSDTYLVSGYPTKYLIDPQGRVAAVQPSLDEVRRLVRSPKQ